MCRQSRTINYISQSPSLIHSIIQVFNKKNKNTHITFKRNKDKPNFQRPRHFFMRIIVLSLVANAVNIPFQRHLDWHRVQTVYRWGNSPFDVQCWLPKTIFPSPTLCTWTNILEENYFWSLLNTEHCLFDPKYLLLQVPQHNTSPSWMSTDCWKLGPPTALLKYIFIFKCIFNLQMCYFKAPKLTPLRARGKHSFICCAHLGRGWSAEGFAHTQHGLQHVEDFLLVGN